MGKLKKQDFNRKRIKFVVYSYFKFKLSRKEVHK